MNKMRLVFAVIVSLLILGKSQAQFLSEPAFCPYAGPNSVALVRIEWHRVSTDYRDTRRRPEFIHDSIDPCGQVVGSYSYYGTAQ